MNKNKRLSFKQLFSRRRLAAWREQQTTSTKSFTMEEKNNIATYSPAAYANPKG